MQEITSKSAKFKKCFGDNHSTLKDVFIALIIVDDKIIKDKKVKSLIIFLSFLKIKIFNCLILFILFFAPIKSNFVIKKYKQKNIGIIIK